MEKRKNVGLVDCMSCETQWSVIFRARSSFEKKKVRNYPIDVEKKPTNNVSFSLERKSKKR